MKLRYVYETMSPRMIVDILQSAAIILIALVETPFVSVSAARRAQRQRRREAIEDADPFNPYRC
jgi:hypothetical protein